jgi:hypothetical protein
MKKVVKVIIGTTVGFGVYFVGMAMAYKLQNEVMKNASFIVIESLAIATGIISSDVVANRLSE